MSDNILVRDATGASVSMRTTETALNLHVPIHRLDSINLTGPAAQSVLNTDLLTGTVNGWYEVGTFFSGVVQIVASAGISAGQIIFEQTNDASSTTGIALPAVAVNSITANPLTVAFSVSASSRLGYGFAISMRYIRVRISTAFTGGTVQAFATFSQQPFASPVLNMQQTTAGNFNATVWPSVPTTHTLNSAASTNLTSVKASSGTLYGGQFFNSGASPRFLKLFNKASAPVLGTDTPVITILIPAGENADLYPGALGMRFTSGIAYAITGAAGDSDATAIGAGEVKVTLNYI